MGPGWVLLGAAAGTGGQIAESCKRRRRRGGRRGSRLDCSFPEVAVRGGSTENSWGGRAEEENRLLGRRRKRHREPLGGGSRWAADPSSGAPPWLVFLAPASQSAQSRNGSSCGGHLPPGSGSARWRTGNTGWPQTGVTGPGCHPGPPLVVCKMARGLISSSETGERNN